MSAPRPVPDGGLIPVGTEVERLRRERETFRGVLASLGYRTEWDAARGWVIHERADPDQPLPAFPPSDPAATNGPTRPEMPDA